MDFPKGVEFHLDWTPSGGLGYREFLERKRNDTNLRMAAPDKLLKMVGAAEQLATFGYSMDNSETRLGVALLKRNIARLLQDAEGGTTRLSTCLRWGMTELGIGLPRLYRPADADSPAWIETIYADIRDAYRRGAYAQALEQVRRAIEGGDGRAGIEDDGRLYFLLGRLHIGSWCGQHKNVAASMVDPIKAEDAFLNAVKRLQRNPVDPETQDETADSSAQDDGAQIRLWAGRAAFCGEKFARAISHIDQALKALPPERTDIAAAAHFLLARCQAASGTTPNASLIHEPLQQAFAEDPALAVEAVCDPLFLNHSEAVSAALEAANTQLKETYQADEADIHATLTKIRRFSYEGVSATSLLRDEVDDLNTATLALNRLKEYGGLLDSAVASQIIVKTKPGSLGLFTHFKTRFAHERWHKWEGLLVTKAAKDADVVLQNARDAHTAAENVYRANGGFDRDGGGEKILYALVCVVLATYMIYVNLHWQANSYPLAALFFIGAGWLIVSYVRRKLGLVEGYDKLRLAKMALLLAEQDAERKGNLAARTWLSYQKTIDLLGRIDPPF